MPIVYIDENELQLTANILKEINPKAGGAEWFRRIILEQIQPGTVTVLSTGGYVASCYLDAAGNTIVRVSLTPYGVAYYLNGKLSPYQDEAKFNYTPAQ